MADPEGVLQSVHNLVLVVKQQQWQNYSLVPSITVLIFDWLLTLHLEVSLVWNSPRSGTKLLFFLTRYLPFIDIPVIMYYTFGYALPQHVCQITLQTSSWMFFIGQCFAVGIFTLRTWAVCGKNRLTTYGILGALGILGILSTPIVILIGLYSGTSTVEASPVPQLFGCIAITNRKYLSAIFALDTFYNGGLTLLMIVEGVHAFRASRSKLMRVAFRDGILYYIYMFGLSLVNTFMILRHPADSYSTMLIPFERVVHSILACRVVLHIRQQGDKDQRGIMMSDQITGPIRFAQATQRTTGPTALMGNSEEFDGR